MSPVLFKSLSPHWATPEGLYKQLDEEFHFDYDPCPLKTPTFAESWKGKRIFCNPPYNKGILPFLQRATVPDVAVFLLPSRTDTRWFHDLVLPFANEIRFIRGRLKFGEATNSAPFPSMIAIFKKQ